MLSIAKKIVPAVALAALFTFTFAGEAQAQHGGGFHHGGHHSGHHGGHHSGGHGFHSSHGHGWGFPTYHDTSHLHYHAPQLQRHGNHFHIQPGHFDVHRTGHWHF
ncbi:hypothetical protein SH528x_000553 [Novipirellula sp. SH528]|uniref:hypothetical protein n=1 Tax=Novipirellula sp. SH528 TaxID=3454466 RepID=UPI003FA05B2F